MVIARVGNSFVVSARDRTSDTHDETVGVVTGHLVADNDFRISNGVSRT